jgi:thiamine pyrophosphokinase
VAARDLAVVVAGGPAGGFARADVPATPGCVVAADGGLDHALALGLAVDVVVGDLDSVTPGALAAAEAAGTRVERHAPNKDRTDLELALDAVLARGAGRVLVLGGVAGRFDHVLANALVLASPAYAGMEVDAVLGGARVAVVRDRRALRGRRGDLLSLLPAHGPARGVRTHGLAYVLADEDLAPGSTRGVSNVFAAATATVALRDGVLLAVSP